VSQPYEEMPIELLLNTGLTPTSKIIWLYLKWRQGENQNCWPSIRTIARELRIAVNTVNHSIIQLKKSSYLICQKPEKYGRGHKNYYQIKVSEIDTFTEEKVSEIDTFRRNKGIKNCDRKVSKTDTELTPLKNTTATAHIPQKPLCDIPPTQEQVQAYSTTRGFPNFDAQHFVEWYAANDWRHKDGKPVLNWKQTVLTWLRRDQAKEQQAEAAKPEPKRGDPGWLPTEEEADAEMKAAGIIK